MNLPSINDLRAEVQSSQRAEARAVEAEKERQAQEEHATRARAAEILPIVRQYIDRLREMDAKPSEVHGSWGSEARVVYGEGYLISPSLYVAVPGCRIEEGWLEPKRFYSHQRFKRRDIPVRDLTLFVHVVPTGIDSDSSQSSGYERLRLVAPERALGVIGDAEHVTKMLAQRLRQAFAAVENADCQFGHASQSDR